MRVSMACSVSFPSVWSPQALSGIRPSFVRGSTSYPRLDKGGQTTVPRASRGSKKSNPKSGL